MAEGDIPFWAGKNAKLVFTFMDATLVVDYTDIEISREGTEVADPICGEDRDRLQFITSHYGVTINAQQQQTDLIKKFIKEQEQLDARNLLKGSSVIILIFPNNGTFASFQCQQYTLDKWKLNIGGRSERNKMALPGRCRYFREIPAI